MTRQHTRQAFDRDGFVVVRQFLSDSEFQELNQNLDRYIRDVVPSLPASDAFYQDRNRTETLKQLQHMGCDPYFEHYRRNERWNALARALIGEDVQTQEPEWFNKPPETEHPTPPHQDNFYFCLRPPHVVTLWLALDAIDEENGCLRYVTGSHQRGIRPHGPTQVLGFSQGILDFSDDDLARERAVRLAPNDLVAHHGATIHRADPNRSAQRNRRAFAMVFQSVCCRRDPKAFQRYEAALRRQHEHLRPTTEN